MQRAVDFFEESNKRDDGEEPSPRQLNGTPRKAPKHTPAQNKTTTL
jgi:hypothetical protein